MLKDITIGQHFPGNSVIHRMDPRAKLLLTIAYIVALFLGSNPIGLALSVLFLIVAYKVANIPMRLVRKSLRPILPIILFTALLNLFFVPGDPQRFCGSRRCCTQSPRIDIESVEITITTPGITAIHQAVVR